MRLADRAREEAAAYDNQDRWARELEAQRLDEAHMAREDLRQKLADRARAEKVVLSRVWGRYEWQLDNYIESGEEDMDGNYVPPRLLTCRHCYAIVEEGYMVEHAATHGIEG